MSRLQSQLNQKSPGHAFYSPLAMLRTVIEPTIAGDAGRQSVEHYLSGRVREEALRDWDEGRASDPPSDWGFSEDINLALQDYLRRTQATSLPAPAPAAAKSTPSPAPTTLPTTLSEASSRHASPQTPLAEIPCVIVIAARSSKTRPRVLFDAELFPGCGAKSVDDVPPAESTQGRFNVHVDLSEYPPGTQVLMMMLRGDQIARLGRVIGCPRDQELPDFHEGLESLLEETQPLRDAYEASKILRELATEVDRLETVRQQEIALESAGNVERERCGDASTWESEFASDGGDALDCLGEVDSASQTVSAASRRYFWLVSLLAGTPMFAGRAKPYQATTVFDETFEIPAHMRFTAADMYCVLMVDA